VTGIEEQSRKIIYLLVGLFRGHLLKSGVGFRLPAPMFGLGLAPVEIVRHELVSEDSILCRIDGDEFGSHFVHDGANEKTGTFFIFFLRFRPPLFFPSQKSYAFA
jgi:hypothetical protein